MKFKIQDKNEDGKILDWEYQLLNQMNVLFNIGHGPIHKKQF